MRRLRLYVDERGRLAMNEAGFSWLAAISLPLWALQRQLYVFAVVALVVVIAANALLVGPAEVVVYVFQVAVPGALANQLHRAYLERTGWRLTAEEPAHGAPATPAPAAPDR